MTRTFIKMIRRTTMFLFTMSVLVFSITYARNCTKYTNKCPENEMTWKRRAQQFNCSNINGKYSCLKDNENRLVETCVDIVLIKKGVVGCPFIVLCSKDNRGLIGLDEDFRDCPFNKTGCPSKNHTGYALNEIYRYPACSTLDSSVPGHEESTTETIDTMSKGTSWLSIVIPLIVIVIVVFGLVGIIVYLRKKGVSSPCSRSAKTPVDTELETTERFLKDVEDNAEEDKSENIRNDPIISDVHKFNDEMSEALNSKDGNSIMAKLDEWQKQPVQIGIAGPSAVGKSSFINIVLGDSVAETGIGNTTTNVKIYHHPTKKHLLFGDLPGYGTPEFELNEDYLAEMNVEEFDFFLIFYSNVLGRIDIEFANHLLRLDKKFAFVRTKADEFTGPHMKHKTFEQWVDLAKTKCQTTLKEKGISDDVHVFVISNVSPHLGDFDNLMNFLTESMPEMKRMNILSTFKRQTFKMIDEKESRLLDRAWKAAIAMGVNAALPLPGLDIAVNMVLLKKEVNFYLEVFLLDELSLEKYPKHYLKKLKTCQEFLAVGLTKFILDSIGKAIVLSTVGNFFEFAIPVLGGIINGAASTYCMYNFLKRLIANLAKDARILIKLQTEDSFV